MMNFKENVIFVLKQRGMTQTKAAKMLGVSKQAFQGYLKGHITLATLNNIADVLDTTPQTLLSDIPLEHVDNAVPARQHMSATTLVCPCCGTEIKILAKTDANKPQ